MTVEIEIVDDRCAHVGVEADACPDDAAVTVLPAGTPLPTSQLSPEECAAVIEALLFASGESLPRSQIECSSGQDEETIDRAIDLLRTRLDHEECGLELVVVANCYQLRTKARLAAFVRNLKVAKPRRLSAAALETLSVVAYRQPIVKSDVEKIRGVDVAPTLKTLIDRSLVKIIGHKPSVGQPALYGTTDEFLKLFGLKSLGELPTLRDLNELENDPGECREEDGHRDARDGSPSQAAEV